MSSIQIIGNIIHCIHPYKLQLIENGYLLVKNGKIAEVENTLSKLDKSIETIYLTNSQILIPGLIDTHIHAPQYPNVGLGYDKTLLDWLLTYTYPTEEKYKDLTFSRVVYNALVNKTLSYGTTTACYFGSLFRESTLTLANAIIDYGQRALVGKINMIRLAPDNYIESREESITETKQFIAELKSKNNKLLLPVITPRFALSVDTELMRELSLIAKEEDVHIQSHISENTDEIYNVHEMYNTDYATAYDNGNLLTNKVEIYKTGGGPPSTPKITGTKGRLLDLLQPQIEPLYSAFDSSAKYFHGNTTQENTVHSLKVIPPSAEFATAPVVEVIEQVVAPVVEVIEPVIASAFEVCSEGNAVQITRKAPKRKLADIYNSVEQFTKAKKSKKDTQKRKAELEIEILQLKRYREEQKEELHGLQVEIEKEKLLQEQLKREQEQIRLEIEKEKLRKLLNG